MEKKTKINNKFLEQRFSGNELKYFKEIIKFGFKFRRDSFIKMLQDKWSINLIENFLLQQILVLHLCTVLLLQ